MTQTPSAKQTCDYQVANWNEDYRTCDRDAVKVAVPEGQPEFRYCKLHWAKAEPFVAQRGIPVSDIR